MADDGADRVAMDANVPDDPRAAARDSQKAQADFAYAEAELEYERLKDKQTDIVSAFDDDVARAAAAIAEAERAKTSSDENLVAAQRSAEKTTDSLQEAQSALREATATHEEAQRQVTKASAAKAVAQSTLDEVNAANDAARQSLTKAKSASEAARRDLTAAHQAHRDALKAQPLEQTRADTARIEGRAVLARAKKTRDEAHAKADEDFQAGPVADEAL